MERLREGKSEGDLLLMSTVSKSNALEAESRSI